MWGWTPWALACLELMKPVELTESIIPAGWPLAPTRKAESETQRKGEARGELRGRPWHSEGLRGLPPSSLELHGASLMGISQTPQPSAGFNLMGLSFVVRE